MIDETRLETNFLVASRELAERNGTAASSGQITARGGTGCRSEGGDGKAGEDGGQKKTARRPLPGVDTLSTLSTAELKCMDGLLVRAGACLKGEESPTLCGIRLDSALRDKILWFLVGKATILLTEYYRQQR